MAAVRKVLEEEHDLIMIGEEDVDTGIAMNQNTNQAQKLRLMAGSRQDCDAVRVLG